MIVRFLVAFFFIATVMVAGAEWEGNFFPGVLFVLALVALGLIGLFFSLALAIYAKRREEEETRRLALNGRGWNEIKIGNLRRQCRRSQARGGWR